MHKNSRRTLRTASTLGNGLAITTLLAAYAPSAQADLAGQYAFSIPPQTLSRALLQFSKQADVQVVGNADTFTNLDSAGVTGEYTGREALQLLLETHPLVFEEVTSRSVRILPQKVGAASSSSDAVAAGSKVMHLAQADVPARGGGASPENDAGRVARATLEEIVVTAERRAESMQSLPIAISAFSGEMLTSRGVAGIEDLSRLAPSLQVMIRPGQEVRVAIRGISTEVEGINGEPPAAISWDGVPYATSRLFAGSFFDIDRVEVLRGPQGTISGRNATAGAINLHSKRPTESFEGGVRATVGNYSRIGAEGYLSGPLGGDQLLGRVAVRSDQADGWVTNTLLNEELNSIDQLNARASLLARPSEDFEAHLILEASRNRSHYLSQVFVEEGRLRPNTPTLGEALGIAGYNWDDHTVQLSNPAKMETEQYQATLRLAWDLGSSAQLTATTGYVDQPEARGDHDNDGLSRAIIAHNRVFTDTTQVSQEITLTADVGDRSDVLVGALYLQSDQRFFADLTLPAIPLAVVSDAEQSLTTWAGYTQWRYRLTDDLRVSAGARYTRDTKDAANRQAVNAGVPTRRSAEHSWSAWTPRVALDYTPTEDLTVYASVSRGFKSGGIELGTNSTFEPEYVWNYEAGLKAKSWDGRLSSALTLFHMKYSDLQQLLFVLTAQGTLGPQTTNAESATNQGVELEIDASLTDRLRLTFAGTWLDATFDELSNHDTLFPELGEPGPGGRNFRDLSGNRVVRAPEWQFNVSGEYRMPLFADMEGRLRASYAWQDEIYFDIFNREAISQGAYGLVNLSGVVETGDGRWQLSAFVYNLTDQRYRTHKQAVIGLTPVPYALAFIGEPRRYGMSLAYRF